ncbi:MAG: hypothetical protein J7463_06720, partial [Roseiflexus sp.]|nr:hypothetical protein [Roseiflexus sp.]
MSQWLRAALSAIMAMIVVGCGPAAPVVTPTPTPTPAEISARAGQATSAAQSLAFSITVTGQPVYT